jgi:hypothetical protein
VDRQPASDLHVSVRVPGKARVGLDGSAWLIPQRSQVQILSPLPTTKDQGFLAGPSSLFRQVSQDLGGGSAATDGSCPRYEETAGHWPVILIEMAGQRSFASHSLSGPRGTQAHGVDCRRQVCSITDRYVAFGEMTVVVDTSASDAQTGVQHTAACLAGSRLTAVPVRPDTAETTVRNPVCASPPYAPCTIRRPGEPCRPGRERPVGCGPEP